MAAGKSDPQGGAPAALSLRLVLSFYGAMALLACVWRLFADGSLPWREGPAAPRLAFPIRVVAGLAAGLALVALSRVWTARSASGRALADELGRLVGPLGTSRAWLLAASSALGEEALFRGAIQAQLGLAVATLLFAAAHFVPTAKLRSWALFALVAGLVFGGLFAATGDLLAPVLAHAVVNGLNLGWIGRRPR